MVTPVQSAATYAPSYAPFIAQAVARQSNAQYVNAYAQLIALRGSSNSINGTPDNLTGTSNLSSLLDSANLVNLSPAALAYLNGIDGLNGVGGGGRIDGLITGYGGDSAGTDALSAAQQQQIANIFGNFSNAPLNQETYNQIQSALIAAGFSQQQLTLQNILLSVNPALLLVYAMNGQYALQRQNDSLREA